jgi:hypothetical protein
MGDLARGSRSKPRAKRRPAPMEYAARSSRQGGRPSLPAPALPIPVHDQPAGRLEPPSVADQHGRTPDPRLRRPTRERPRHFHRSLQRGDDPAKVAGLILRILQAPAPKLRYSAGHDGRWIPHLKTLIPQRTSDRLLRRSLHLPNPDHH